MLLDLYFHSLASQRDYHFPILLSRFATTSKDSLSLALTRASLRLSLDRRYARRRKRYTAIPRLIVPFFFFFNFALIN